MRLTKVKMIKRKTLVTKRYLIITTGLVLKKVLILVVALLASTFFFFSTPSFGNDDNANRIDAWNRLDRFEANVKRPIAITDGIWKVVEEDKKNIARLIQNDEIEGTWTLAYFRSYAIADAFQNNPLEIRIFLEMAAKSDLPGRRFSVADLAKKALPSVDYKLTKNYCYCNDGEAIKRLPGYDSLCKGQLHYPPTDKNRNCENENAYYREYYQIPFSYFRELVQELIDNGAQDLIAQPILADIINAPDKVAGKYEFISNHNNRNQYGVDISDSKLAWLIARNLNIACMADNIVKPLGFPVTEEKCENYIPYPTNKLFLKHWAIQLADDDKSIIYYDSDSKVHGLPDDSDDQAKQSDSSMPYAMVMKGKYHLGFDNRAMLLALEVTASKWDIRKNKEAIKYQWLKHNCQDFIIEVIKEYLQDSLYQGGNSYHKIYLKKITSAKQAIE